MQVGERDRVREEKKGEERGEEGEADMKSAEAWPLPPS
jgi:hypothetical protein